jgi:hypothetical protein
VRKYKLPSSILCLLFSFILLPVVKAGNNSAEIKNHNLNSNKSLRNTAVANAEYTSSLLYDSLHLNRIGLCKEALLCAYKGQQKLIGKGMISNHDVITICDFSQPSENKRMYIIDVRNFKVLLNTYVAHGKNSGLAYAKRFSNRFRSLQSSLGFYITKNTYFGEHGLSLKLSGQERGFNDNAEKRAVVIHGASYIGDQRQTSSYMGRSFGCPAVPQQLAPKVINLIKDGSCLFIYYPSKSYLHGSRILNG